MRGRLRFTDILVDGDTLRMDGLYLNLDAIVVDCMGEYLCTVCIEDNNILDLYDSLKWNDKGNWNENHCNKVIESMQRPTGSKWLFCNKMMPLLIYKKIPYPDVHSVSTMLTELEGVDLDNILLFCLLQSL